MQDVVSGSTTELSGLITRVVANNAGPMTAAGTNTYLIGRRELAIIDPGPADPLHIDAIMAAVGERCVRYVLVTHTHPDHSPAAAILAEKTGAQLIGCVLEDDGHQDRSFMVDANVHDGDLIAGSDFTLEAIATPGHVGNHFCYLLREESALFTGDHIMGGSSVVIVPPSGDMADYLASLTRLKWYPLANLMPGHGPVLGNPLQVIDGLLAHRLMREEKVVRSLANAGEVTLGELTPIVYDDVDQKLHLVAQVSLWAHLLKLEKEGRAAKVIEQHWLFGQQRWRLVSCGE